MGGRGLRVALAASVGEAHVDAPAVDVTHVPLHQAVLLEPADQAGQRALAQVHGIGQFLNAELVLLVLGKPLEHLELANAEPVPLAQRLSTSAALTAA